MVNRALLVGLGRIGVGYDRELDPNKFVYTHARAMTRHPAFRLVGGVDPDAEQRSLLEHAYGVEAYATLDNVPAETSPDVVIVAAPTEAHGELVTAVLRRWRPRAILCEKPLSYDLQEADRMQAACEARGVALFVNFIRRADPAAIEIKHRIDVGEIAQPLKGVAWYSKGFLHNGSHFVDLLGYWLGPIVTARLIEAGRPYGVKDGEPDVRVVFERGTAVFLAAREEAFSHYTIELVAQNGRLRYDRGGERVDWQPVAPHPRLRGYTVLSDAAESLMSGMDRYQWHVAEQLAAAMDGREHHLCSGRQAVATQAPMQALLEEQCP